MRNAIWILGGAGAVLAAFTLWIVFRIRRVPPRRLSEPYDEVKRRIRAGVSDGDVIDIEGPSSHPRNLEDIFRLEEPKAFYGALVELLTHRTAKGSMETWRPSERSILAIWALEGDVNNGGFDQYFFNSSGDTAKEALAGLERIGAEKMATILREAMSVFPDGCPSPNREERWKQIDALGDEARQLWHRLDSEFFDYPNDIAGLVFKYCQAHREDLAGS